MHDLEINTTENLPEKPDKGTDGVSPSFLVNVVLGEQSMDIIHSLLHLIACFFLRLATAFYCNILRP